MHRDVKSDNILISTAGDVRLTGFQYSCFLQSQ
jgi:serine/threonine protein kinase